MAIERVTEGDVDAARADLERAEAEVVRLREAYLNNEHRDYDSVKDAEEVVRRAEADYIRVQRAKIRYDADVVPELRKLRADALKNAPEDTKEFVALAKRVWTDAVALEDFVQKHNAMVTEISQRGRALGVPDQGVISAAHENLGLNSVDDVLIDDLIIQKVDVKHVLGLLFQSVQNGIIPRDDGPEVQGAFKMLGNAGKAVA